MTIGEHIRRARNRAGRTQQEVANTCDMTRSSVSQWESGSTMPGADDIRAMALLFDCTADELLGLESEEGAAGSAWAREWLEIGRRLTPEQRRVFRQLVLEDETTTPPPPAALAGNPRRKTMTGD